MIPSDGVSMVLVLSVAGLVVATAGAWLMWRRRRARARGVEVPAMVAAIVIAPAAVKAAADFERSMKEVAQMSDHVTAEQYRDRVLALSRETRASIPEAIERARYELPGEG